METMQRRLAGWAQMLLLAAAALAAGAHAQDTDVDPPGRVARLSEASGQVWLYSPDGAEWIAAARNQPLTTGDRLATEAGARAELQIGSTTVRLDASSELEVVQLDDDHVALELHDGSVIAHVRDLNGAGQLDLTTEEGRFIALRAGVYRFDRDNGKSDVTVYSGQARYEGPNSGLSVNAGQRAQFWIDSGGVAQYSSLSPVSDAFAAWSNDRDRRVVGSIAERYVSPEMTGAAELDAYGRWEQTPDYGSVWIPTAVAADWAPYSQGHWAFVRPWGWTWVDAAPWGFAPFHYGRWVYLRNTWCWTPGTRVARPIYAPALVGWVGGSRGSVSVTIGGGPAVGWFPLAPREVYVPSYRVSPRYARNVNITNVTNVTVINNVFANPQGPREFENRRSPRAITVVPSNVMAERRPVGPAAAQYRQTPWVRDFANQPGRTTAMLAPPVATPPMPVRGPESRAVRPPPGARPDAGDRPGFNAGRPGFSPRDRNETDRDRGERDRRPPPAAVPPVTGAAPAVTRPAAPFDAGNRRPDMQPGAPGRMPRDREAGESTPGMAIRPPAAQPAAPAQPAQPVLPAAQSPRPTVVAPVQERPTMRPLPVQRGEDRRIEDRREERRDERRPQRPEAQQPSEVRPVQTQRPERPTMQAPAPRPVEVQRPAAPAPIPAAQPVQRVETPRAPEQPRAQRPEPRGDEPRRGGEQREPKDAR